MIWLQYKEKRTGIIIITSHPNIYTNEHTPFTSLPFTVSGQFLVRIFFAIKDR